MPQDTGLIKRGLMLLGLMAAMVVVLLTIILQRAPQTLPKATARPELAAAALVRTDAAFPAAVSWVGIQKIAEAFPSAPGWRIRYNAAGTLARRGSNDVPWDVILEMLDEPRQLRNFPVVLQDGTLVPDEAAARGTMLSALKAVAEWHKKHEKEEPSTDLKQVYAAVDKLATNPIMELKTQAENTRTTFFR